MILSKEQIKKFEQASKPLIEFLNEFHPHVKVIVENDGAELLEGSCSIKNEEFIKD